MRRRYLALLPLLFLLAGCESLLPHKLPKESPPLIDMEEPLHLFEEPEDEAARRELPPGSFTGVEVGTARTSLSQAEEPEGVLVTDVVTNSPGDAAGLVRDDLLLSYTGPEGEEHVLTWPSEWREMELETPPGTTIHLAYDRAGATRETDLVLIPRVRPRPRIESERYREEERVGVVLRTATEVEARSAGLGPGGGAVVVGLSANSPWRDVDLKFGDLIVAVDGVPVDHPQVVLDAIREGDGPLEVEYLRDGGRHTVSAPLSRRAQEMQNVAVPPLFDWERDRDTTELSILLGLILHKSTPAAWEWRLLWIFRIAGGDADRLKEVNR